MYLKINKAVGVASLLWLGVKAWLNDCNPYFII
nr:MAG TPA: hypothetical protein [Caudoviricetes sp.]